MDPAVGLPVSWIQALCITTPRDRTAATSPADAHFMPGCTASRAAPVQACGELTFRIAGEVCVSAVRWGHCSGQQHALDVQLCGNGPLAQ